MFLRKLTLALITVAFLGGMAGAEGCCDSKSEQKPTPKATTTLKPGWFTSGAAVGASAETSGECCKGLPAGSKDCCKNQPEGQKSCGGSCGGKCEKEKK